MSAPRILVVDDVPENLEVIGNLLDAKGVDLSFATNGAQALRSAALTRPDLVLLDVAMPGMDGFEVARRLKADPGLAGTPVIFITARVRPEDALEGFRAGGVDYVTKPFSGAELVARVSTHLELKKSRDTILRQVEDLRALNAAKDRFLSIVAHDLKNPLHGIISLSELLLDLGDGMDDEAKRGHLASLHGTARQMSKTLHDLLDWARVQRGAYDWNPQPVDLAAVAEESLLLTQSMAASKEVTVLCRVPRGRMVHADPIMILTVLRNLMHNAVKYSRRTGTVTITSEDAGAHALRVVVCDAGIGMSASLAASLLSVEPHASRPGTDGERGTGLGLQFCREFLAKHGSTLEVRSVEGKGTTVSFVLPTPSASAAHSVPG